MKPLSRIKQLDRQFPGLESRVRTWFDQGISARRVAQILEEQYGINIPRPTVSNFRRRYWRRDRERQELERIDTASAAEFARLLELKRTSRITFPGVSQ